MNEGPERIGEILSRLFTARGWGRRQGRMRLEQAWAEVVGKELAEKSRVGALRRNVLDVEVANAILLQEMAQFQKRKLLEQLRARLPDVPINDLRFRVGNW